MMRNRLFLIPALLGISALGAAQTATPEELNARIRLAYETFWLDHSPSPNVHAFGLYTETTDNVDGRVSNYQTWVTWYSDKTNNREDFRIQVIQRKNGKLQARVVGNGENLYTYDAISNEYSVKAYGKFSGRQPQTYRSNFLTFLSESTPSRSQSTVRLATEIAGSDAPYFRNWLAGTIPTGSRAGGSVTFATPDLAKNVVINVGTAGELVGVTTEDYQIVAGKNRQIRSVIKEWTVAKMGAPVRRTDPDFIFNPPTGARAIPNARTIVN